MSAVTNCPNILCHNFPAATSGKGQVNNRMFGCLVGWDKHAALMPWAFDTTLDTNHPACLGWNNPSIRQVSLASARPFLIGRGPFFLMPDLNAILLVFCVCRFQYSLQGVMNLLARGSCIPLRCIGKIHIGSSRGGLADLSEFRHQDGQGIAIFNVVRKKLLFQFGVPGCLPLHSPNNGLQARSVRTTPGRPKKAP